MPDIGLFELLLIGLLLFVVVGPERMPEFFSQIGRWVNSGRGWISQLKGELSREAADITAPVNEAKQQVQSQFDQHFRPQIDEVNRAILEAEAKAKPADSISGSGDASEQVKDDREKCDR